MLTEEAKYRIKQDHIEFLERRHKELVRRLEREKKEREEAEKRREIERIRQEEEDAFYDDNPNYVKYTGNDGRIKWVTREEFQRKRYRKRRVRKKHRRSFTKTLWNNISVILIVVCMLLIIYFAFKLVAQ